MEEELFTRKQMENAVMLAADLYQRMYNSPATDGGALEVAGTVIDEACRMEAWLTEKYGEDDDAYLDRLDEYESLLMEKYELEDEPKQTVWVLFAESLCDYELMGRHIVVYKDEEEARKAFKQYADESRKAADDNDWVIGNDSTDFFEAYPDGSWGTSHETVELNKTVLNEKVCCHL